MLTSTQVVDILERVFSKPVKVKYGNIHLLAILVSAIYRYHQGFVIGVVDNVLEHITLGLELNDFKFNQKRVAEVKYLGELYNYKIIDSPVIFDTLYRIVTFGHGALRYAFPLYAQLLTGFQKVEPQWLASTTLWIFRMTFSVSVWFVLCSTPVAIASIVDPRRRS